MDNNNQENSTNQAAPSQFQPQQPQQSQQSVQPEVPQYQSSPPSSPPFPQPVKSSSNLAMIIAALAILLLAIAALVYVFMVAKNNKPAQNNYVQVSPTVTSQTVISPTQAISNGEVTISPQVTETPSASPSPSLTANGTVPAGYVKKTTLCYTTFIPQDAMVGKDNGCRQDITNSTLKPYIYTEKIDPIFVDSRYQNLDDLVNKRIIDSTYKLIKDENIVLDGVPARKLTEKNSKLNLSTVRVFVYLPDKYESSGVKLAGFEITTTLDGNTSPAEQAHNEKVFATLLSSWHWQ